MNMSVLLVEDNELNRDMLSRRLTRAGYSVKTVGDGEQALASVRKSKPSVILLDMNLPIMDGWTTCENIRADKKISDVVVIALTAHAMSEDRDRAIAAGCNEYATKPVDFPELLAKIEKLCGDPKP